jgi:hypothetical protein
VDGWMDGRVSEERKISKLRIIQNRTRSVGILYLWLSFSLTFCSEICIIYGV